ncbi:MAG TPA: hypothetical protein VF711_12665 [Acidimicrobiales bacterium]
MGVNARRLYAGFPQTTPIIGGPCVQWGTRPTPGSCRRWGEGQGDLPDFATLESIMP